MLLYPGARYGYGYLYYQNTFSNHYILLGVARYLFPFFFLFFSFFLASFVDSILIKIYTRKETQIEEERIEKFSKGSRRGNAAMLP